MFRSVIKLFVVSSFLFLHPLASASADKQFIGCPGQNYTVTKSFNLKTEVCVKMRNYMTGEPAIASFWSIGIFGNKSLKKHTGDICLNLGGPIKFRLRVGHIQSPTDFYVYIGRTSVENTISFTSEDFPNDGITEPPNIGKPNEEFTIPIGPEDFPSYYFPERPNPCIPMCKNVDLPKGFIPPRCRWTCNTVAQGNAGWQIKCSKKKDGRGRGNLHFFRDELDERDFLP